MKPIENIFGFDCGTCEHNRHCYGGNMGNQFRYCEKSTKKIQNLDNLERQNKQLKDNWNKLKEYLHNVDAVIDYSENYDGRFINYDELLIKMRELEQGSDSNE
jgi:hypothetical protein